MAWALDARRSGPMSPDARLTLVALADYANAELDHQAWPSARTLAERIGVSERSIRRHLATLREQGAISPGNQRHADRYPANQRPVVYRLDLTSRGASTVTPDSAGRGDSADALGVTALSPKPRNLTLNENPTPDPRPAGDVEADEPVCRSCGVIGDHDTSDCTAPPHRPIPAATPRPSVFARERRAAQAGRLDLRRFRPDGTCRTCDDSHGPADACTPPAPPPPGWRDAPPPDGAIPLDQPLPL